MTKIIAWNINGLRSIMKTEHLYNTINKYKPNIICMGEIKLTCPFTNIMNELKQKIKGYRYRFFSPCSVKKGYSGTAIFTKKKPLNVSYGLYDIDNEGRVITLEYMNYFLVHVYTPNSGMHLKRLKYRTETWDKNFRKYIISLQKKKKVIVCGDLNVAHKEIDLKNPKTNKRTAGFTNEERKSFNLFLNKTKMIDTYRHLNKDKVEYSYWSYRFKSREKNVGWRIDYFIVSKNFKFKKSCILTDIMGSDHAPILLSF